MNYEEAAAYIKGTEKYGSSLGLDNMKRLCKKFNNAENDIKIIHIAGTNGKGSTGAFIDSILRSAGMNVCRYISPVVFPGEEPFKYNGEDITKEELAYYMSLVRAEAEEICSEGFPHPTRFELETMLMFLYCRGKNCDYAVLETGMGGRLDAVNVISKSRISVITSISMDHSAFLGDTIEKIAYEKAGIIKENGIVVSARQISAAAEVLEAVCMKKRARLTFADKVSNIRANVFDYDDMRDVRISLDGEFQADNAAAAIETCSELGISEEHIRCGLMNTVWRARFETICTEPLFIIDGAHNEDAANRLLEALHIRFGGKSLNFIMGVLKDKEYDKIAGITAPFAEKIYTVTPDNARGLSAETLKQTVLKYNKNVEASDIEAAVGKCMADREGITVAFGSLSYLGKLSGEVKKYSKRSLQR